MLQKRKKYHKPFKLIKLNSAHFEKQRLIQRVYNKKIIQKEILRPLDGNRSKNPLLKREK